MKKKKSKAVTKEVAKVSEAMAIWNEDEVAIEEASEQTSLDVEAATEEEEVHVELEASNDSEDEILADDTEMEAEEDESVATEAELEGTELESFESAEIENLEILTEEQTVSVIESVLFSTDKPVSLAQMRQIFRGSNVKSKEIRAALETLASQMADHHRGVTVEEVSTGYQLRTKVDNLRFLRQSVKARPFRLSGQALEVLSIVAYKQPCTKAQIDEIRGVESGHLLRALMEKNLCTFGEKSELPGKPMFYETTRKFLEIFGLRNIRELPSLHEIDELIPEGIGPEEEKETLSDLTGQLSQQIGTSYSEGEDELLKITDELSTITTSSEFFEQEKQRMRDKRDLERAQDIREAIALGEKVEDKDQRWLERYDEAQILKQQGAAEAEFVAAAEDGAAEDPESRSMQ